MSSEFQPLIKNTSSLNEKKVLVQGSNSFSRENIENSNEASATNNLPKSLVSKDQEDRRLKATTTQKTSASTNLKINTLKPFLKEVEGLNKATFNDIISLLADNYAQTKFTTRQLEAYKSMYKTQFDMLDK